MRHRVFGIALAICLLFLTVPSSVRAELDIVEISDAAGLAAIAKDLSGRYKLTADIELEAAWTPLTDLAGGRAPFTGRLDGGGHTVSNLFMEEDTEYASLIGDIAHPAEIRDLHVELGAQGVSSPFDASGLVSSMDGGLIQNCSVTGKVVNTVPEDGHAGALVGYMFDGTVSGCYATGSVSGGSAGGLIGYIEGGTVENSYSLAKVNGQTTAGGFAGEAETCSISHCYAAGTVSTTETSGDKGGFLGARYRGGILTSCFYQFEDATSQKPEGIGSDQGDLMSSVPEGKKESSLTSGASLSEDWDLEIWYFSTGAYPQLQWARKQTEEPLAPPAVSSIIYSESAQSGNYELQFPVVKEAVAYQIEIFDHSTAPTGSTRLAPPAQAKPLYTGLFTLDFPGMTSVSVPLGDLLTKAAKADIALHPQRSAFSYSVSVTAIGSGNTMGAPSDLTVLPEMQRLTGVKELPPIICERGDALQTPVALSGTINGVETDLSIRWSYPDVFPSTADFLGHRTYEAPLVLPFHVLNPDGYRAQQTVHAYDTHQPPQDLAWDPASLGKATWKLPDEPGGAVSVCLLDQNQNPVSEEKLVPRQVEQSYDFSETIRQLGTGNYYFRVKTKASADGYFRESAWAAVAEACPYTVSGSGMTSDPENGAPPTASIEPGKGTPATGDNSDIEVWIALTLLASGCFVGTLLYTRKEKTN